MSDVDDLKTMLRDNADEMHVDPQMPTNLRTRARRRRLGTALLTSAMAAGIGVAAFAGAAHLVSNQAEPRPANPPADRTFTFVVPSDAMLPTYAVGDLVEIDPTERVPVRGNVILFSDPNGEAIPTGAGGCPSRDDCFLKRVIGLPGETLEIRDGRVFVDGNPLSEPYALMDSSTFGPVKVAAGTCFVMGDNRANSADSRSLLGPIPEELIIGTVARPPNDQSVPNAVRESGVAYMKGRYGHVAEVYAEGRLTRAEWAAAEPGNTQSIDVAGHEAEFVYVLFFTGRFEVQLPPISNCRESDSGCVLSYKAGRLILDADGYPLNEQLWLERKSADPLVGPAFED